jgi:hypothetical protein
LCFEGFQEKLNNFQTLQTPATYKRSHDTKLGDYQLGNFEHFQRIAGAATAILSKYL